MNFSSPDAMNLHFGTALPPSWGPNFVASPPYFGWQDLTSISSPGLSYTFEPSTIGCMNINVNCTFIPSRAPCSSAPRVRREKKKKSVESWPEHSASKHFEESVMNLMRPIHQDAIAKASKLNPDAPVFHPRDERSMDSCTSSSSSPSVSTMMSERMGFPCMRSSLGRNSPILRERPMHSRASPGADGEPSSESPVQLELRQESLSLPKSLSDSHVGSASSETLRGNDAESVSMSCDSRSKVENSWKNCKNPHLASLLGSDGEESNDEGSDDEDWDCVDDYDPDSESRLPPPDINLELFGSFGSCLGHRQSKNRRPNSHGNASSPVCDTSNCNSAKQNGDFRISFSSYLSDSDEEDCEDEVDGVGDHGPTYSRDGVKYDILWSDARNPDRRACYSRKKRKYLSKRHRGRLYKVFKSQFWSGDESDDDQDEWIRFRDTADGKRSPTKREADVPDGGKKRVHFPSKGNLRQVRRMCTWKRAHDLARLGEWRRWATDRGRFNDRIERLDRILSCVLEPGHRERIYQERFTERVPESSV